MKHVLRTPIVIPGTQTITELNLREELCAGDFRGIRMRAINDPTGDDMIKLISRLSGHPEAVIAKMGEQDFDDVGSKVFGFFKREAPPPSGPPTPTAP